MCGIFALIGYNPSLQLDETYFMTGKKRGPEFSTLQKFGKNYFGFHRLAINGLSSNGNQPFEYKNYVLICNGEIYNYKQLIHDYNLNVTSGSDCEVILHLYHLFGSKCLNKLDGEFSFVIYDKIENFFLEYHGKASDTHKLNELLKLVDNAGFKVYIKMAADNLKHPFAQKETGTIYDVQLNIFCYK
jgi:asparagine synthase (glutamine-hydrolysing)